MVNDSSSLRYLGYLLYCKSKPPLSSKQEMISSERTNGWFQVSHLVHADSVFYYCSIAAAAAALIQLTRLLLDAFWSRLSSHP